MQNLKGYATWKGERTRHAIMSLPACTRYCHQQRVVLRQLEDLNAKERKMVELDNRKDQVMTVLKVALSNVGMWVRDQFFPLVYAQASWQRLLPFFEL
jgi:Fe-S-cluster-containing dehydrogenase component